MRVLFINPPHSGKSIPEERYGVDSIKRIFKGEPLALESLAGALPEHETRILDLKVEPDGEAALSRTLVDFKPELVGITAVTCEANAAPALARLVKEHGDVPVVVGGVHASLDPEYFNRPEIDFIVSGLGRASLAQLVQGLESGLLDPIPGLARTAPGAALKLAKRDYAKADLLDALPPRYDLTASYRDAYILDRYKLELGLVVSSFGCPHRCTFCCIPSLTDGKWLAHELSNLVRDVDLVNAPVVRIVDPNFFADKRRAEAALEALAGKGKQWVVDLRADDVVHRADLVKRFAEIGLRAVIVGFEEIDDARLTAMNKSSAADSNRRAVEILHENRVSVVGDFIVSPDYREADFDRLGAYIAENRIDLPVVTILTPFPGTKLYDAMRESIAVRDLDYYTLTNAVTPTALPEAEFYARFAALVTTAHADSRV